MSAYTPPTTRPPARTCRTSLTGSLPHVGERAVLGLHDGDVRESETAVVVRGHVVGPDHAREPVHLLQRGLHLGGVARPRLLQRLTQQQHGVIAHARAEVRRLLVLLLVLLVVL